MFSTRIINLYFLIIILIELSFSDKIEVEINSKNFLIGISQIGLKKANNLTVECSKDLEIFLKAVNDRDIWALKLIDSFGNVPSSINWGNYFWFSSREYCNDLNDPFYIQLAAKTSNSINVTSPIPLRFTMIYYNFSTPTFVDLKLDFEQTIHVGLCLPQSCSAKELTKIADEYFGLKYFQPQHLYNITMKQVGYKIPGFKWSFIFNTGVVLFTLTLISALIFAGLAEFLKKSQQIHKKRSFTILEDFVLCFDLKDNLRRTFEIESSKNFITVIAGLRTVICVWVTMFHVYYYSLFTFKNIPFVFAKLESVLLQPVLQSCFYVDVFFVISGFLLVNNILSNSIYVQLIKKNSWWKNVIIFSKIFIHRYIRLVPALYIIMCISVAMYEFLDMFTPFKMDNYNGLFNPETWWYNFLFINNFLKLKYISSSWTWYLACEMQFFVFFLIIIFIYLKNEKFGKFLYIGSLLAFTVISFLCHYFYGITFHLDNQHALVEYLYSKPWTRIIPYFGGVLVGWIHCQTKIEANGFQLSRTNYFSFWTFTLVLYLTTIYMNFWRDAPVWFVSGVMSFGKLFFGIFIGLIIFLCEHGYGGYFAIIMSSKPFLFINKFCYGIYMMAPAIIMTVFGLRTEGTYFTEIASFTDIQGILITSWVSSVILISLLEIPLIKFSNKFILIKK